MFAASLLVPASAFATQGDQGTGPDGLYVVGFTQLPDAVTRDGVFEGHPVLSVNPLLATITVEAENGDTLERRAFDRLDVRYVAYDDPAAVRALGAPNDPLLDEQYGPQQIGALTAWGETLGDSDIRVAIVDSGIDNDHPDLVGRIALERDFAEDDTVAQDDCGHGTHVAGIAGAGVDNGEGIAGMATVSLIDAKALSADPGGGCTGSLSDVADAISWAAQRGAHVISLSLGADTTAPVLQDAIAYAVDQGALLVAAAGNVGPCSSCVLYPAAYEDVIAVGCTNTTRGQCAFSASGPEVELAAPGSSILSTDPGGGYLPRSGTSMSVPHVSGVAALMLAVNPSLERDELRSILGTTARDLGPSGRDTAFGFGEVDAAAAVEHVAEQTNRPPEPSLTFDCISLTCTFDATSSSDPDGDPLSYTWDLDDGTIANGSVIEHTFPRSGGYIVQLTVDDGELSERTYAFADVTFVVEIRALALQNKYGATERPEIRVEVTALGTQEGVPWERLDVRTYWESSIGPEQGGLTDAYDERIQSQPARGLFERAGIYQETTGNTGKTGTTTVELPAMTEAAGKGLSPPSPGHTVVVEVRTTIEGSTYRAYTSYAATV